MRPSEVRRARTLRSAGTIVLGLLLAGCAPSAPSGDAGSPVASGPVVRLDCGATDYPCTPAEIAPAVRDRSASLSAEVSDRFAKGALPADLETFLRGQADVAEAEADDSAVRFRLKGGRPEWVVDDPSIGTAGAAATSGAAAILGPARRADIQLAAFRSIVGPQVAAKKALVLSPFLWDFGATDDGGTVAGILGKTRGYEGGVTVAANAKASDKTVDVASFKGWDADHNAYQVVHVASHGARICKTTPCRAVIIVRLLSGTVDGTFVGSRGFELDPGEATETGVEVVHTVGRDLKLLALDADFFRSQYPGGLGDTVVFFNACEIFGTEATDLGDALRGVAGEFLGWSQKVDSGVAFKAAAALYPLLSDGRPLKAALALIGPLATDPAAPHGVLTLGSPENGGDLRIRDLVTLHDPSSGARLAANDPVPIQGQLNDGKPDLVPYVVSVDGLDAADAGHAILHVSIDGKEAAPVSVSSGKSDGKTSWTLSGTLDLGSDLTAPRPADLRAFVELPEGGQNQDEMTVNLTGNDRPTGTVWKAHITRSGPEVLGTIDTTLTLDVIFEFSGPGLGGSLRYAVTSGTYTWTYGPTFEAGCKWSAPAVSGALTKDNAGDSYGLNFFVLSPTDIQWSAGVSFDGDATTRTVDCRPDRGVHVDTIHAVGDVSIPELGLMGMLSGSADTGSDTTVNGKITVTWTISKVR